MKTDREFVTTEFSTFIIITTTNFQKIDKMFSENNYNYTDYHDDASDENK